MKKYEVKVEEILSRIVKIEAESEKEAEEIARRMYADEEIVLDYNDFDDYDITTIGKVEK